MTPFSEHFSSLLTDELYRVVSACPQSLTGKKLNFPTIGSLIAQLPELSNSTETSQSKLIEDGDEESSVPAVIPQPIEEVDWEQLDVKIPSKNIVEACSKHVNSLLRSLTPLQKDILSIIYKYHDFYFTERNTHNSKEIVFIYCLHAINHIIKARSEIIQHNVAIKDKKSSSDNFRDQGLVRPKVLILVPFRRSALNIVEVISSILLSDEKANIANKKRFYDEFTGDTLILPKKNPKPADYEEMFSGNIDDTFRIGLAVTKKSLKLYTDFYSSDIIIASPLGLRMLIGAEGDKERDYDFLASIELLILDQTEIFLMQNWDHLLHVFNHLHLQPVESHGTDFSRVRTWALNGWAKYYRQTLIFSSLHSSEIAGLISKYCFNYAGRLTSVNIITSGSICQVIVEYPQVFHKIVGKNATEIIDARFEFFTKKILPNYQDTLMKNTLIYVPSYFDFVRIRNYFKREDVNFVQISEYTKDRKLARARDLFYHSENHFLLYSERFHFFRRIRLRGIRHIIFYQPPTFANFYSELLNFMQDAYQNLESGDKGNMTVTVLYSKYDAPQLASIVGSTRASKMIVSDKNVHMFVSES